MPRRASALDAGQLALLFEAESEVPVQSPAANDPVAKAKHLLPPPVEEQPQEDPAPPVEAPRPPVIVDEEREAHVEAARRALAEPTRNARNFVIADAEAVLPAFGKGLDEGRIARIDANIAALKLLKQVEHERREPEDAEKLTLARYSGWGGLAEAFGPSYLPSEQVERVKDVLTEEELRAVRNGVLNAHYTPPLVASAVYDALTRIGTTGGRILEPSCGTGVFLGVMPPAWRSTSGVTAIELDPVSARIASLLYPDARIVADGFEKTPLPDNFFDVAISNVPFGNYPLVDPERPDLRLSIHNAFFARALRKVRTGGVVAFITSTYTLDAYHHQARKLFDREAELIAAIRLPKSVHRISASTEVAADLILLRRREAPKAPDEKPSVWVAAEHLTGNVHAAYRNKYWDEAPREFVLGRHICERGAHGASRWTVEREPAQNLVLLLEAAVAALPEGICTPPQRDNTEVLDLTLPAATGLKPGAYLEREGLIYMVLPGGDTEALQLPVPQRERLVGLIAVRDALKDLLRAQTESTDDEPLEGLRLMLNGAYDRFIKRFGPLHSRTNRRAFAGDPDLPCLLAIEDWDDEAERATKAEIFYRRTVEPAKLPEHCGSVKEALLASLGFAGKVDVALIARLTGKDETSVLAELTLDRLAFLDPVSEEWQVAAIYLSGDVRDKLAAAEAAAAGDARFERNVEALRNALPPAIPVHDIHIAPGAVFVEPGDIEAYLDHLRNSTNTSTVTVRAGTREWMIQSRGRYPVDTTTWGLPERPLGELMADACNGRSPTIYQTIVDSNGDEREVTDPKKTLLARQFIPLLRDGFRTFILSQPERATRVEREFNERFNRFVPTHYDGSHLALPGFNRAIELRPHQKDAIWRALMSTCGVFHAVGAGKTMTAAAIAMEKRRLGLRRRPAILCPNHLVEQHAAEFLRAYPAAQLLVIGAEDMSKERRQVMLARIATGDFDAIVMSHSSFFKIAAPKEVKALAAELQAPLDDAQAALESQSGYDRWAMKAIERSRRVLMAQLDRLVSRAEQDNHITFDALGIDELLVDESQAFKNLWFVTRMDRIAGLSTSASLRALDMYAKCRAVQAKNGERGGVDFLTGTPVTNTLAEMYTLMRFLAFQKLRALGIEHFDDWAKVFGETVTSLELTPEGGSFRLQERFARFRNLPELMALFATFADVRTRDDLALPVPALEGGGPQVVRIPPSPELRAYIGTLVERAERIRDPDPANRPDPSEDNMLLVTTDGRKAALDLRLVDSEARDDPGSKLNTLIANVHAIWARTAERRLTQLVFLDLGTPGGDTINLYEEIKTKLIRHGVPEGEVAFIHDAKTDTPKAALFKRVNRGDVRVLIGSTAKMGTGTNVQRLLVAKHDADAPWRPDEVEQRDGRILRQGNTNAEIGLYRYVTEGSFDAYTWQLLEHKARFVAQVMSGRCTVRSAEDIEGRVLSYAEVKALATGNPMIIERAKLQAEENRLASMERAHYESIARAGRMVEDCHGQLDEIARRRAALEIDRKRVQDVGGDSFRIVILGRSYGPGETTSAGEALLRAAKRVTFAMSGPWQRIGAFGGFDLTLRRGFDNTGVLYLEGEWAYPVELGDSPVGAIQRLRNVLRFDDALAQSDRREEEIRARLVEAKAAARREFAHRAELTEVRDKLEALERDLGIADDTSGGLGESPMEEVP